MLIERKEKACPAPAQAGTPVQLLNPPSMGPVFDGRRLWELRGEVGTRICEYSSLLAYRKYTDIVRAVLDEHAAPLICICGVTAKWEWNVHVAGRLEPRELTEHTDERVELRLENFRRIKILPDLGPPAPKGFSTCRNWQFSWTAFPETWS